MSVHIDLGQTKAGGPALLDLQELLATRLLVQGNSGSGKSHLLRRLLEQSAPSVQHVVVDPEGDFVTLAEAFGHVVIDAAAYTESGLQTLAERVRRHRISIVLNLEHQDVVRQMRSVAAFLGGLFDVDRSLWFPALVVVDEAQVFAPAAAGDVPDEARKATLGAMTNLMCRGRKRGLAGVIATQRLAKLAKNVAAEASNFLMGRTFLDIDMARAADLLGMERRQAEMFRDLRRGQFVALGPALSRRPLAVTIGPATTIGRSVSNDLLATPPTLGQDASDLLTAEAGGTPVAASANKASVRPILFDTAPSDPLQEDVSEPVQSRLGPEASPSGLGPEAPPSGLGPEASPSGLGPEASPSGLNPEAPPSGPPPVRHDIPQGSVIQKPPPSQSVLQSFGASSDLYTDVVRQILSDPDAPHHSMAVLYQDFLVRCRARGLSGRGLGLPGFRRRVTLARAGLAEDAKNDPMWERAFALAEQVPEDVRSLFLVLVRAALEQAPCPSDAAMAWARGSRSARRARGALTYLEERGVITVREDVHGNRVIAIPDLGCETAPAPPDEVSSHTDASCSAPS